MAKRTTRMRMTKEEKELRDDIYIMMSNVLGYEKEQELPSFVGLRLAGLRNGKFVNNMKIESKRDYSYEVVWVAFKMSMPEIKIALSSRTFKDENHKVNYIIKIIESNLNEAFVRLENKKNIKKE